MLETLEPRRRPLLEALASEIEVQRGVRIAPTDWDLARLPAYLKMTFSVEDEQGRVIASGQDLSALREQVRPKLRAALAAATRKLERTGQTTWTFGKIPKVVALPGTGQSIRAYPSLVDEGTTVGLRALESPEAQRLNMRAGMRRLLTLTIPSPARAYQAKLGNQAALALLEAPHASVGAVLEDASTAAITALMGEPVFDEASFEQVRVHVAGHAQGVMARIIADVVRILQAAREVRRQLDNLHGAALDPVRRDVASQIGRLVFPGFISATGARRLPDVERYLRGAAWRLERLTKSGGRRPRPDEGDPRARGRAPARARGAAGGRRRRRARRGAVAARGAADQLLRAGDRAQGPAVGQADPPHPRRRRPLTANDPLQGVAGRSRPAGPAATMPGPTGPERNVATGGNAAVTRVKCAAVEFAILGPLRIGGPGGVIRIGAPKQRALLAALLLAYRDDGVSRRG